MFLIHFIMKKMGGLMSHCSGLDGLRFPKDANEVSVCMDTVWKNLDVSIASIVENPEKATFENTVAQFSRVMASVMNQASVYMFYASVAVDESVREACRNVEGEYSSRFSKLLSRRDLYLRIKEVYDRLGNAGRRRMDPLDQKLLNSCMGDFEESGVDLPRRRKETFLHLKSQLSELGVEFEKNMSEDNSTLKLTSFEMTGCDTDLMSRTIKSDGMHEISGVEGDVMYILSECTIPSTRKKVKEFWDKRCLENLNVLEKLHQNRNELARVLGHDSSSHYKLCGEMLRNPENAISFLNHVLKILDQSTRNYLEELVKLKNRELYGHDHAKIGNRKRKRIVDLESEDFLYYHHMYLRNSFGVDHQVIREYFPTVHVLPEMLKIYSTVMGVTFRILSDPRKFRYYDTVEIYSVYDDDQLIGNVILDLYPREGKYSHFCEMDVTLGFQDSEGIQHLPVVALLGNFPEGGLLTHSDVETLFHEFGHVVHAICGGYKAKYYEMSGNRVETDFNETPSELFEQWVWEPWVLRRITRHCQNGGAMPDFMIHNLIRSRHAGACHEWSRLACLSKIDLTIHSRRRLNQEEMVSLMSEMSESYLYQRTFGEKLATWGHIGSYDYDSLNYSYVWSMVLACDLYGKFKDCGSDLSKLREVGLLFRQKILEPGGSNRAWKNVKGFLGRPPNARRFLVDCLGLDSGMVDKKMEELDFDSSSEEGF